MAAIHAIKNQFLGINPLLQTRLQLDGSWDNFHMNHIADLTRFLQRDLRQIGYLAQAEQSLQIRRRNDPVRALESDVTVYDPERRERRPTAVHGGLAVPVAELLDLDEADMATYRAVGIYEKTGDDRRGDAVAWLELLSPSNKPGGRHYPAYRDKRTALLQAGLVFIEVDYLHHQPPTVAVPEYPDQAGSSCYRIILIDPRPDWLTGAGRVFPIGVDETLPRFDIPLRGTDVLDFAFDPPYQQTYEALYLGDEVDYARHPDEMHRYSADDRARVLSRLLAIRERGTVDRPVPIDPLPLAEAEARWRRDGV